MKLDIECVRDIMLCLENQPTFVNMTIPELRSHLPDGKYSLEQVKYTCLRLNEGNLLHLYFYQSPVSGESEPQFVGDLTFEGHQFIGDLKSKDVWKRLSPVFKKGASASFETIKDVAVAIATEAFKANLHLIK